VFCVGITATFAALGSLTGCQVDKAHRIQHVERDLVHLSRDVYDSYLEALVVLFTRQQQDAAHSSPSSAEAAALLELAADAAAIRRTFDELEREYGRLKRDYPGVGDATQDEFDAFDAALEQMLKGAALLFVNATAALNVVPDYWTASHDLDEALHDVHEEAHGVALACLAALALVAILVLIAATVSFARAATEIEKRGQERRARDHVSEQLAIQSKVIEQLAHELRNKYTHAASLLEELMEWLADESKSGDELKAELVRSEDDVRRSAGLLHEADRIIATRLSLHAVYAGAYVARTHVVDLGAAMRDAVGQVAFAAARCVDCRAVLAVPLAGRPRRRAGALRRIADDDDHPRATEDDEESSSSPVVVVVFSTAATADPSRSGDPDAAARPTSRRRSGVPTTTTSSKSDGPPTPTSVSVSVDTYMWHHVATALLSNACKATVEGRVELAFLGADARGKQLLFAVRDTGKGIADELRERLFVEDVSTAAVRGVGLGLVAARDFARAVGGDVWLERTRVGEGSEFRFRLPGSLVATVVAAPSTSHRLLGLGSGDDHLSCDEEASCHDDDDDDAAASGTRRQSPGGRRRRPHVGSSASKSRGVAPPAIVVSVRGGTAESAPQRVSPPLCDDDDDDRLSALPRELTCYVMDDSSLIRKSIVAKLRAAARKYYRGGPDGPAEWTFREFETVEALLPHVERIKDDAATLVTVDHNCDSAGGTLTGSDLIAALSEARFKGLVVSASGDASCADEHRRLGAHITFGKPLPPVDKIAADLGAAFAARRATSMSGSAGAPVSTATSSSSSSSSSSRRSEQQQTEEVETAASPKTSPPLDA